MKSMLMSIIREIKLIFRDGITVYLTISPALLALVFVLVFGSIQESTIRLAVDASVPAEVIARLETVADVEMMPDNESLVRRISGADSIAGVLMRGQTFVLLVEGNEAQGFAEARAQLIGAVLSGETQEYTAVAVESQHSLAYTISMACILLLALFIGGASMGLSGVNERESGVLRAITISPMTLFSYVASKLLPALLFGMIGIACCVLIMGRMDTLAPFLLLAGGSVLVSGIIAFLIITFSDNKIAAVGVLKIIMPVFLIVGISAVFVPQGWSILYYALPMYWQYTAMDAILTGKAALLPILMTLGTGMVWFALVMILFTQKVKIKAWR